MAATKTKPKTSARPATTNGSARAKEMWDQYYASPSPDLLRVYADVLTEEGDPRGPFLQLCLVDAPTSEQTAAKEAMIKRVTKKVLAGPGGELLREMEFGPNGLVAKARAEAGIVLEHADTLARINPRLVLTITSIKTLKAAKEFASASLGEIWFVDLSAMVGAVDGLSLNDKELDALAPALADVRHLNLPCRGGKWFNPSGLAALGRHLKRLRYLSFDFDNDPYYPGAPHGPPAAEYAEVIRTAPGFEGLRGLDLRGITAADFPGRDIVVPGLVGYGGLQDETRAKEAAGISFAEQLEAALASR